MKILPHDVRDKLADWQQKIATELSREAVGGVSEGNSVDVFFDGDEAFDAMLHAISNATEFIHLEMYMFLSDSTGKKFANALAERALAGVNVRIAYDSIGSSDANPLQWGDLRDAGAHVAEFRPVRFWQKHGGILGRNHRKNLVIDGKIAFTGGMNIGDPWSRDASGNDAWRDTHLSVQGPAAADLNQLFLDTWLYTTGEEIPNTPTSPCQCGKARCIVIGSQGLGSRKQIRTLFSVQLANARHSVKMTMPYFLPPRRLRKALQQTTRRGVDLSILVPRDSDVPLIDWLREGLYPKLLEWNIRMIEYLGPILHAKTMLIDDHLSVIGSNNFDPLSVQMNREVALVIFDDATAEELNTQWENDLMLSERVATDWSGLRPWWRLTIAKIGCFLIRRL